MLAVRRWSVFQLPDSPVRQLLAEMADVRDFAADPRPILDRRKKVWLPSRHYQGAGDTWDRFAESKGPLRRLKGFLLSLWMATWHWNDMTMMRMPGVRDRVVRVLLKKGEGGVNIKMSGKEILDLAKALWETGGGRVREKVRQRGQPRMVRTPLGSVQPTAHLTARADRLFRLFSRSGPPYAASEKTDRCISQRCSTGRPQNTATVRSSFREGPERSPGGGADGSSSGTIAARVDV